MPGRRASDYLLIILKPITALILKCLVNYRVHKTPPRGLKPPYLVISSHITDFDVFLLMLNLNEFPVAVVHELLSKNMLLRRLLRLFGAIIKRSGIPEAMCIRQMKRAVSAGRSVLIYPQGDVVWAGRNEPLTREFAQLVRYLAVPVLVMRQDGAYTTYPRWANGVRRGRIDIYFELAVDADEAASLSEDEILMRLSAHYDHDEKAWLKEGPGKDVKYISLAPARGLQRFLFMCPSCGTYGQMQGRGRALKCGACGRSTSVTPRLDLKGNEAGMEDIWHWHDWQIPEWEARIREGVSGNTLELAEEDPVVRVISIPPVTATPMGPSSFPGRAWEQGVLLQAARCKLTAEGMYVTGRGGEVLKHISPRDIEMVYVASFYRPNLLVVKSGGEYFRIRFRRHSNPAYAWSLAIRVMTEESVFVRNSKRREGR